MEETIELSFDAKELYFLRLALDGTVCTNEQEQIRHLYDKITQAECDLRLHHGD